MGANPHHFALARLQTTLQVLAARPLRVGVARAILARRQAVNCMILLCFSYSPRSRETLSLIFVMVGRLILATLSPQTGRVLTKAIKGTQPHALKAADGPRERDRISRLAMGRIRHGAAAV